MNKSNLNHSLTPLFLQVVNSQLAICLEASAEHFSSERFYQICDVRHKVVVRTLARLDKTEREAFAEHEYQVNQQLEELAQALLSNAKSEAVKFYRGRAAVNKYK